MEEGCLDITQIEELLEWEANDHGIAFVTAEEFYQGFPHEPMMGPKAALLPITWEKALAVKGLDEGEMNERDPPYLMAQPELPWAKLLRSSVELSLKQGLGLM